MSKMIEGKLANQNPRLSFFGGKPYANCETCNKRLNIPDKSFFQSNGSLFNLWSYLGTDRFIYESNSGRSVVYCSDYCRKKHNHRFQK